MDRKTTMLIGGFAGLLAGMFFGDKYKGVANVATTTAIDKLDKDDDDVNALSGAGNQNNVASENVQPASTPDADITSENLSG